MTPNVSILDAFTDAFEDNDDGFTTIKDLAERGITKMEPLDYDDFYYGAYGDEQSEQNEQNEQIKDEQSFDDEQRVKEEPLDPADQVSDLVNKVQKVEPVAEDDEDAPLRYLSTKKLNAIQFKNKICEIKAKKKEEEKESGNHRSH